MTLPQEALAAQGSNEVQDFGGLILPAEKIFDAARTEADLRSACEPAKDAKAIRTATVDVLKQAMQSGRAEIARALDKNPFASGPAVKSYSYLMDGIVTAAHNVVLRFLHPCPNPTEAEKFTIFAVGGTAGLTWRRFPMSICYF